MQVTQLVAGDTFNPAATVTPNYPASAGWVLKYRLTPLAAGVPEILLVCAAAGDDHQPSAPASLTARWVPGPYTWASWVERAGESYSLERGQLTVLPDPRTAPAGTDARTQAQRALDDLKAALAAHAASQGVVAEYEIAGRRMKFKSAAEIIKLIAHYEAEVERESLAAQGLTPARRRIFTRI